MIDFAGLENERKNVISAYKIAMKLKNKRRKVFVKLWILTNPKKNFEMMSANYPTQNPHQPHFQALLFFPFCLWNAKIR